MMIGRHIQFKPSTTPPMQPKQQQQHCTGRYGQSDAVNETNVVVVIVGHGD